MVVITSLNLSSPRIYLLMVEKLKRKTLTSKKKEQLLSMNARVCCICRKRGQGINFHHIDGTPSNNDLTNVAVLCVKDHDAHHRPETYAESNHLDLGAEKIMNAKVEWETFVKEARKENPRVLAVINVYGTEKRIDSMRLILQTNDSKIIFERIYHLHKGPPESWIDMALDEVCWIAPKAPITVISKPLSIEYCSSCNNSLSNIVDRNFATMMTASDWSEKSICSIYINPLRASLAILISYEHDNLFMASLHKCGTFLHFHCDKYDKRIPIKKSPGVRTQATRLVHKVLKEWHPARIFIGTGDEDKPELIQTFSLPLHWEN
jgi:hypothetical protein